MHERVFLRVNSIKPNLDISILPAAKSNQSKGVFIHLLDLTNRSWNKTCGPAFPVERSNQFIGLPKRSFIFQKIHKICFKMQCFDMQCFNIQ